MADSTGISSGISRDLSNLDVTKLTPLSPEVICKQATINIGTIGHVAHGKSTVVKALSGVQTVRFKNELERNITIKLGQKEEGGAAQESRVHSTVGAEDDEDLQVLAEIQSTMAGLQSSVKEEKFSPKKCDDENNLIDSPSRPSVITHTELDSPAKRNLNLEEDFVDPKTSSTTNGLPDSPESMESEPPPPPQPKVLKRKPGPKSKTRPVDDDEDKKEEEKKDTDDESVNSSEASRIVKKRKMGVKSPVHSDDSADLFESSSRSSRTRSKRDSLGSTQSTESERKRRELRAKRRSYRDNSSDSDVSVPPPAKKRGRSTKVEKAKVDDDNHDSNSESVDNKSKPVEKKKYKKGVNDYKVRRKSKRKHKPNMKNVVVSKETPSETRQIQDDGPVDMTVGRQYDGEYEVETVKGSKKIEGRQYYYVKWRGWPDSFNTWEPMDNLIHSQEALLEFFQSETKRSLERLSELANEIPGLVALTGKFAEYERDVVSTLVKEDFDGMDVNMPEGSAAILPSYKLLCSHISKYLKNNDDDLEVKIKHLIITREFVRQRFEQEKALAQWEKDMAKKSQETVPLTVENSVDLEGPPDNFHFVKHNIAGEGVEIPDDPPVGCECSDCEDDSSCCGVQSGSKFAYTSEGLLKVEHGTPVYECNKICKCDASCPNRVVQNGRTAKLHIFRTPNNIGWGVKVLEDVPQGKFICEYMGEVLKREVADERMKNEYKGRPLYIFDLDFNDAKEFPYTVDAYQYGNVSHFINHSCEPNLAVYAVWIDCLDPNLPRLAMFAIRDIKAGEELTFDYSAQYHRKRKSQPNAKQPQQRPGKTPCRCGSGLCRQVLFETSRAFTQ